MIHENQKIVSPQEGLISISQLQQHPHRLYSCCAVNIFELLIIL